VFKIPKLHLIAAKWYGCTDWAGTETTVPLIIKCITLRDTEKNTKCLTLQDIEKNTKSGSDLDPSLISFPSHL